VPKLHLLLKTSMLFLVFFVALQPFNINRYG
jgi:hypothetical protein